MHKLEKLNSQAHQHLKVTSGDRAEDKPSAHLCHIVVSEFADAAQFYPLFFSKDRDTGQFQPIALFGLMVDENIYQKSGLWDKCYLPLLLQSQPFYLMDDNSADGATGAPSLAIDVNDSRVQHHHGQALFVEQQATTYVRRKGEMLAKLANGFRQNREFIATLLAHELLEPVTLNITYIDQQEHHLEGLYTINKQRLAKVPKEAQTLFEARGYVALMHSALGSVGHVETLIKIKNSLLHSS